MEVKHYSVRFVLQQFEMLYRHTFLEAEEPPELWAKWANYYVRNVDLCLAAKNEKSSN